MFVKLGQRSTSEDVVDLLEQCHARIRKFLGLAAELARAADLDPEEVRSAAGSVQRYFAVAFPLHLSDEEELIIPRLEQQGALADALATVRSQHAEHEADVTHLGELCAELERDPGQLARLAPALAATAARLREHLEEHLVLEEQTMFPALRALPAAVREELHAAMRQRRS